MLDPQLASGANMELRVDANEAWPAAAEAVAKIQEALEPFGISSVEQPSPHEDLAALAEVRRQVRTPIMLDESLCGRVDAERAGAAAGACDLFNLRLSKCGGFIPTLRLAQFAKRAWFGVSARLSGRRNGNIAGTAGRHFAATVAGLRFLEGSYDRHLVRER